MIDDDLIRSKAPLCSQRVLRIRGIFFLLQQRLIDTDIPYSPINWKSWKLSEITVSWNFEWLLIFQFNGDKCFFFLNL